VSCDGSVPPPCVLEHSNTPLTGRRSRRHGFAARQQTHSTRFSRSVFRHGRPMEQGRPLCFHPVVSVFLLLFSSPSLSGRRLDVYHTSTHGVALVRIYNAGLKCAADGSLEMQDPKIAKYLPSGHNRTTSSGYIFATSACIDNYWKNC